MESPENQYVERTRAEEDKYSPFHEGDIVYRPYDPGSVGKIITVLFPGNRYIVKRANGETYSSHNVNDFLKLVEGHERKAKKHRESYEKAKDINGGAV